ncbi:MSC_0775 family lipoprotein [Mesomycoplasma lagogenitalium]|uniref:Lipoprotein n=1 Tax=Mesomycoplasma lagogenitalium TaxID=171286 RepID=A0ABY8LTY5_9BACT|nr:hypothetical protein [Mesomycoplasma lagogenitalium]WGI36697.1 hypothetical protein QEG99_00205 [Mesomycoplasma lagogenitalium]
MKRKYKFLLSSLLTASPVITFLSCTPASQKQEFKKEEESDLNPKEKVKLPELNNIDVKKTDIKIDTYILDKVKDIYNSLAEKDFLVYTNQLDPNLNGKPLNLDKIYPTDLIKNNYVKRFADVDIEKIKSILLQNSKFDQKEKEFIKSLTFKVHYSHIHLKNDNLLKVYVPIEIISKVPNKKPSLYQSRFIESITEFKNVDIENTTSERKYKILMQEFNKLKQFLQNNLQSISLKLNKEQLNKILEKWNLNELSSEQYKEFIDLSFSSELQTLINGIESIKDEKEKTSIKAKIRIIDAYFKNNQFDKLYLKVRYATGKVDENGFSDYNHGEDLEYFINLENNYLLEQYIKFQTNFHFNEVNNIYEFNFLNLKKEDMYFIFKDEKIKLIDYQITKKDPKNATIKFTVEYNGQKIENILMNFGVGNYVYQFEKQFQNDNYQAHNFIAEKITADNILKINNSLFTAYGNQIFSGGFDTLRAFYTKNTDIANSLHLGEDYLAPQFQPIVAPYDGEIIAIYNSPSDQPASGIGTTLMMKINYSQLKLTPREFENHFKTPYDSQGFFYIGFIHLDASKTLNNSNLNIVVSNKEINKRKMTYAGNISPKTPLKVKQGQIMGYLGSHATNGGWMTHVHTTLVANGKGYYNDNGFYQEIKINERFNKYDPEKGRLSDIRVQGVAVAPKTQIKNVDPITAKSDKNGKNDPLYYTINVLDWHKRHGVLVNPNAIYKIRGEQSFWFNIEELNNLEN